MKKLAILVAVHKPTKVYSNEIYIPIHVGKSKSKLDLNFLTDNIGENISEKNSMYCELTALYWAWKNLDCEYIGLCHYRRYFKTEFTENNIDKYMQNTDAILANPIYLPTDINMFLRNALIPEDIILIYKIIEKYFPEDYKIISKYILKNKFYPCNMFICKKKIFDNLASWLFPILKQIEKNIPFSSHSREKRLLGYISEVLIPIYFITHNYKIKTDYLTDFIGSNKILLKQTYLKKLKNNLIYTLTKSKEIIIPEDIMTSLKQDKYIE